jgi:hypothetical protein
MVMRLTALLLPLSLFVGCVSSGGARPAGVPAVAPLSESEFDRFATRLTEQLIGALEAGEYAVPATVAPPVVSDDHCVENRETALRFARRLTEGLNDRLGGSVRFRRPALSGPQLRSSLDFTARKPDYLRRTITFVLRDAGTDRELMRESCAYTVRPKRVAARPRIPSRRKIEIDREARGLADFVQRQARYYRDYIVAGLDGDVVFVDRKAWQRFWLKAQRVVRTADDRLRVELELRARGRSRTADLRLLFLDDRGRQVEATPVLPYRLMPYYTKTVVVTSESERAVRYICLIAD